MILTKPSNIDVSIFKRPILGGILVLLIALITAPAIGTAQEKKLTGKPWIDMDYGPVMSHSFQAESPGRNIAYKGKWIKFENGNSALFDTDLLRWAGAWTQSDLNWRNVIFDGSHGTHPSIQGNQLLGTSLVPGWSTSEEFTDPREFPYGPMPKEKARYLGAYRNGDQVIFKYRFNKSEILDTVNALETGVSRTINAASVGSPLYVLISDAGKEKVTIKRIVTDLGTVFTVQIGEKEPAESSGSLQLKSLNQGLVGHWKFEDKSAAEIANSAGKSMTGKASSAKFSKGVEGNAIFLNGKDQVGFSKEVPVEMAKKSYAIAAWVKSNSGTIVAKGPKEGKWQPKGKSLFVRDGRLVFDVGWVGAVTSKKRIGDGKWHHVAMNYDHKSSEVQLFIDGKKDSQKKLPSEDDPEHVFRIGYTATNFAPAMKGMLDEVRLYDRKLSGNEVAKMANVELEQLVQNLTVLAGRNDEVKLNAKNQIFLKLAPRDSVAIATINAHFGQLKPKKGADLSKWITGGQTQFAETITTQVEKGTEKGAYARDTFALPRKNPWRSWMRIGGFDFYKDATKAAVCTWSGDVWTVEGLDKQELTWRRIATGMFQPLGLKIVDDVIYVGCRDQITRLHDLNDDGEVDFYESFNHDHQVTEHFHEFAMDLQTDKEGNFYFAKSARHALDSVIPHHGTLIKVSRDGSKSEIVCNGFRAANGVGIGPKGELATSDQEGHWTPANRINLCKPDGFYGNMYSFHRGEKPTSYDPPLVWLPKNVDRSPAAQLWCPSDKWGPFQGKMLSTSYGTGKLWHVMYEVVDGVAQGGVVQMPTTFPTGSMRGRFHPVDGQLYVCGLVGWSSDTGTDGGFYRVRYTGKPANMPVAMKTTDEGIYLTFSDPLDRDAAEDIDNYNIEQWNYRWSKNYGSPHFSVANPKKRGQDEVELWEATLSEDGKTIFLEIEDLEPVMQMQIGFTLKSKAGDKVNHNIWLTINKLGKSK